MPPNNFLGNWVKFGIKAAPILCPTLWCCDINHRFLFNCPPKALRGKYIKYRLDNIVDVKGAMESSLSLTRHGIILSLSSECEEL